MFSWIVTPASRAAVAIVRVETPGSAWASPAVKKTGTPIAREFRHQIPDLCTVENARAQLKGLAIWLSAGDALLVGFGLRRDENAAGLEAGGTLSETLRQLDPQPVPASAARGISASWRPC